MGVSGLSRILKEYSKNKQGIREVDLSIYKGQRLAIDINIYLHGFAYNPTQKKPNSHIDGFFQMICDLLKNGILPVMILDGKPPKAKADTCRTRSETKQELQVKAGVLAKEIDELMNRLEKLEDDKPKPVIVKKSEAETKEDVIEIPVKELKSAITAGDAIVTGDTIPAGDAQNVPPQLNMADIIQQISQKQTEMEKYLRRNIKIQSTMYSDIKTLFQYMGIPCLKAQGEADALCVRLFQEKFVAGVLSEDMDILPFGGKIIRGIKEKRILTLTEYSLPEILSNIGLTQSQLADLCILCGCDYSPKVKNIGPKSAMVLLKKYKNIEGILDKHIEPEFKRKLKPGKKHKYHANNVDHFKREFLEARQVFMESPGKESIVDIEKQLVLGSLDQNQLLSFLKARCRYRPATLDKKMKEIASAYAGATFCNSSSNSNYDCNMVQSNSLNPNNSTFPNKAKPIIKQKPRVKPITKKKLKPLPTKTFKKI